MRYCNRLCSVCLHRCWAHVAPLLWLKLSHVPPPKGHNMLLAVRYPLLCWLFVRHLRSGWRRLLADGVKAGCGCEGKRLIWAVDVADTTGPENETARLVRQNKRDRLVGRYSHGSMSPTPRIVEQAICLRTGVCSTMTDGSVDVAHG